MDVHDLHKRKRNTKDKGVNVQWSVPMDKCLLETLAIQAKNGNKIDRYFNENAYTAACNAMNSQFDLNLDKQKVKNRLKTIKKMYKVMRDLLRQDGFKWNPISKSVECQSEELWDRQIAACAGVKQFRGKQIEMYDELNVVCRNCQASTSSQLKDESLRPKMKNDDENSASFVSPGSEDQTDTDGNDSDSDPQENNSQMPTGNNQDPERQIPKRPRKSEVLQDALGAVALSIHRLTDSMEKRNVSFNPSELLKAVMEIDDLEKAKQMYAFEYLSADPVKARVFLTYNAHMRKTYLFRHFWWWK